MSQQKRYAYLIGANGPKINGQCLKYAERDVELMARALTGPSSRCQFVNAKSVIADERHHVLADLNEYVKQCLPEDVLIVHFSGHGYFDQDLYLVCNHSDENDPVSSAINIRDLKRYLQRCQARYKALILDCCHSGAAVAGMYDKDLPKVDLQEVEKQLNETLQGSVSIIITACSRTKKARELESLDGGAGFLSWAIRRACTDDFDRASTDQQSLSLTEVWRWMLALLKQENSRLNVQDRLPDPMCNYLQIGTSNEIWLTDPPLLNHKHLMPKHDELRKQYLEKISTRYNAVTLPIGPAEGFSLQAIFQPLALRRDPLTADLEHKQRRTLLGEEREDERSEHHRKGGPGAKEQPIRAEHGEEALKQSPKGRLVILGGPGTGKTTTLKHLIGRQAQSALADPTVYTPIFLSLADLARSGKTLHSYLFDLVEELGIERSYADILWNERQQGHTFVALDSLDEVAPELRPRMIELVNSRASEDGNVWVVGSRFTEYKGGQFKQGQFSEWELLPMSATLRRELATKLLPIIATLLSPTATSSLSPTAFVTELEKHPHAAAWGDNPLLFSLAAVVFVKTGGLPASRATLYNNVIEAVLTLREQDGIRRAHLLRAMSGLALWLHQEKGRTFTNNDLLTFLEEIQQTSWEEAEHIAKRMVTSGILDVVGHDTYGFRHQTFQEYLAAIELAKRLTSGDTQIREEAWQFIWKKRTYSRWTEVLRLMVGALAQLPGNKGRATAFRWLKALLSQRDTEEGDPGELGLALALKSAVEVTEIPEWKMVKTVQLEMQLVKLWWRELLMAVRNGRETKAERLGELVQDVKHFQLCEKEAISKPIVLALRDFDEEVRDTASNILQELSNWVSTQALLPMLEDRDENVRRAAIEVLGTQGERVPLKALLPMLEDEDGTVRRAVIEVLGAQGERVPLEALLPMLEDKDGNVRRAADRSVRGTGRACSLGGLAPHA